MSYSSSYMTFQVSCAVHEKPSQVPKNSFDNFTVKQTVFPEMRKTIERSKLTMKKASARLVEAFVDSVFEFADLPLPESQKNYAPVDEVGEAVVINTIEGMIPCDFPQGVYVRNGSNPLFGGLKSTKSVFGKSKHVWIEGEGMLHGLYFSKENENSSKWSIWYNNKHVETETFKLEKLRNKPSFLPTIGGDSTAVLSAYFFNLLRFGKVNKQISNTSVFEHSGKLYSIAENHMPQEIDISTLQTLGNWHLSSTWNRPFTSHPKRAPDTNELVIIGVDPVKPHLEVGVISADGEKLVHRADLKLDRCTLCHDFAVTQRYNVFMDFPLTIDIMRLIAGGPLINYSKEDYARIGIMPRYGDADSTKWFNVEQNCTFHVFNCFEDEDEVVLWGCRALESVITAGNKVKSETNANDDSLYDRPYEWRLNMRTNQVKERNLTSDAEFCMDFPTINHKFNGVKSKFGYTQVVKPLSTSTSDNISKFGGVAKLYFGQARRESEEVIKVEYHMFEKNIFCSGSTFVPKDGVGLDEDDGWIVTFVHNEDTNLSQVFVIDTKKFTDEPVAKITLPCRVPYGFHGAFIGKSLG